jgi:hypothetical protein
MFRSTAGSFQPQEAAEAADGMTAATIDAARPVTTALKADREMVMRPSLRFR